MSVSAEATASLALKLTVEMQKLSDSGEAEILVVLTTEEVKVIALALAGIVSSDISDERHHSKRETL